MLNNMVVQIRRLRS